MAAARRPARSEPTNSQFFLLCKALHNKKNWLFVGSERAGRRAAAIQTLLGTAKLNGLNSAEWLKDTLEKLPTWPNSRIDELLPLAPEVIEAFKRNRPEPAKW